MANVVFMASAEHDFVSSCFLDVAEELAASEIYGYQEASRGVFDFACHLTHHKSRSIVGQTLQKHAAGIEKDLNKLLFDHAESVPVYLFSDTARHRSRIGEVVQNAKVRLPDRVGLLRLYSYPVFDADDASDRAVVRDTVRNYVVDDLLMNVVLGRLGPNDVLIFLRETGISGMQLACLESIGHNGFLNYPTLATSLGSDVKPTTLRSRVANLTAAGLLKGPLNVSAYFISQRGRVFLKLCSLLDDPNPSPELVFIAQRLGIFDSGLDESTGGQRVTAIGKLLLHEISSSKESFGTMLDRGPYEDDPAGMLNLLPDSDHIWVER